MVSDKIDQTFLNTFSNIPQLVGVTKVHLSIGLQSMNNVRKSCNLKQFIYCTF